jgi:hypothetical protein
MPLLSSSGTRPACPGSVRTLLLLALLGGIAGCARESPTGPTRNPDLVVPLNSSLIEITALVLEYGTEEPIAEASVFLNSRAVGQTDDAGTLTTHAAPGLELTMYATAPGYRRSLTVAGTPYNAERWTFFLEKQM